MTIRRSYWLLLLLALTFSAPMRASASVVFISQDDNGREFTLDRGDALEISLPATSGTGYTWQAQPVAGKFIREAIHGLAAQPTTLWDVGADKGA